MKPIPTSTLRPTGSTFASNRPSVHQHDLRISGGTERLDYSMAVGYMKQDGVFIANDWADQISMDLKLGIQLNKYIKVGGSLYGNMRHYTEPGYGTNKVMDAMMRAIPIMSDYHKNGIYGSSWIATPGRGNYENPRMIIEQGSIDRRVQQAAGQGVREADAPFTASPTTPISASANATPAAKTTFRPCTP